MKLSTSITFVTICAFFYLQTVEANPSRCYYCALSCQNPLQIHNCETSNSTKITCISSTVTTNGQTTHVKGCVQDNADNRATCQSINAHGGMCYMCGLDLCNAL